jgi:predicted nucleotidyltransferase
MRYPFYREIRGIVAKTVGVEGRLRQAFEGIAGIKVAFIHGSFASGREKPSSDIDVFVIGEASLRELSAPLRKAQKALAREINITLYSEDEYRKRREEKAGFLEDVLKAPKIILRGNKHDL